MHRRYQLQLSAVIVLEADGVAKKEGGRIYDVEDEEDSEEDEGYEYCNHGRLLGHCRRSECVAAFEDLMEDMYEYSSSYRDGARGR